MNSRVFHMVQVGVYACVVAFHSTVNILFFILTWYVVILDMGYRIYILWDMGYDAAPAPPLSFPRMPFCFLRQSMLARRLHIHVGARDGLSPSDRTNAH